MILASCTNNNAGPEAKGTRAVISFAEGGIRFALDSSSLVSVFSGSTMDTLPPLRAYMPHTALTEETSHTLQGLIAWKDLLRSFRMQYAPPGSWEVSSMTKTRTVYPAHLLFRQVFLFVVGKFLSPHPRTNTLNSPNRAPSRTSFKQAESMRIPRIIITPPPIAPLHHASVNTVPTPQNAAFGNQLVVPDPEFTVINCWKCPEIPFADAFGSDGFSSDLFSGFGGCPSPSWGDPEDANEVVECAPWEKRVEDDAGALELGPTWSG